MTATDPRHCVAVPHQPDTPALWSIVHPGDEDAVCDGCVCVRVGYLLSFHRFLVIVPVLPHTERAVTR